MKLSFANIKKLAPASIRGLWLKTFKSHSGLLAQAKAFRQLQKAQDNLARAQQVANLGVWELDLATSGLTWSDEIYKIFEIDTGKFTPSYGAFLEVIHPEDREKFALAYESSLLSQEKFNVVHRLLMADGRVKWVEEQCSTLFDENGRALISTGVIYEITRQKEAEEKFKSFLELASDAVHIIDEEGNVIECSKSFATSLGYSYEEALQLNVRDWDCAIPESEQKPRIQELLHSPKTFTSRHKRKDGTIMDVEISSQAVTIAGRRYLYAAGRDITRQKQLEKRLQKERQKYKNIIDLAADGLFILDSETSVLVEWSQMVPKMLGYLPEELGNLTVLDWDKGFSTLGEFMKFAHQIGFEPVNFERVHTRKDGSTYDAAISAVRLSMDDGEFFFVSARDISQQKRRIAIQQAREAQLQTITNASHDAILMMNPQGEISFWNPAAEKILGYTTDEVIGKDLHRLIVPSQHWQAFDAGFTDFLKTGTGNVIGQTLEHIALHKDGHNIPISISIASVLLENQWHAVGVIRDDTLRHLAIEKEERLRREERSLLSLFDKGDTLLLKWNNDEKLTTAYVSKNVVSFLGMEKDQYHDKSITYSSFVHPDDLASFSEKFRDAVRADLDYFTHEPYRIVSSSGITRWVLNHIVTQKNEAGRITHFIGYLSDITSQKQIEERTRELKEEFETIFNAVPIPIAYIDNQGVIFRRNEAFVNLTGYTEQDVPDFDTWSFKAFPDTRIRQESLERWRGYLAEAEKSDGIIKSDLYIVTNNDGTMRPLAAAGRLIKGGLLATLIDMSEEENAKQALIEAREQADSANLAKSRFLANMSHEFRTPLNSVIGLTQMLVQRQGLAPEVREEVENIHTSGQMLLALVNDILDLSKIEAGEISFEMIPLKLSSVLSELRAMLLSQTRKKGIDLIVPALPAIAEGYVISDPTRLRQILLNLLTNAIKFTSNGTVSLSVESAGPLQTSDERAHYEHLRFSIKDTGCGIPKDILPALFSPFRQADSSITRKYGGTGLGLAIVRQLTEGLGGKVSVESVEGEGSCFSVELPFRRATDEEVKKAGLDRKKLHILLADDDPDHRKLLVGICDQLGWDVETTSNGMELLRRYKELQDEGWQIDCLIVAWQLPELNGLEVLSRLGKEYGADEVPSILMINNGTERKQLESCRHKQTPDLIVNKPLAMVDLINGLGQLFSKRTADIDLVLRSTKLDLTHLAWLSGVHILVVDDAQTNLDLAVRLFGREGAAISTCMNGQEALEWLQTPENHVDIVLMDIQMPLMDGNTAVREIRRIDSLKHLPVIALTAAALASERKISLEAGMNDYQTKPYDIERMVRLIRKYVGTMKGKPVPVKEKQEKTLAGPTWPVIEGIEVEQARQQLNNDLDLFLNLLRRFITDNQDLKHPTMLPENHAGRDLLQARMHKLAGSAGLIGMTDLSALAKQLENRLRDNEYENIPALLEQLRVNFLQLDTFIIPALEDISLDDCTERPMPLADAELDNLCEALQQKKISAMKIYRELQTPLRQVMADTCYQDLDNAVAKLDFATALRLLDKLKANLAADSEAQEDKSP